MLSDESGVAEHPSSPLAFAAEYEDLLPKSSEPLDFPDFDENTRATTFYTTATTGNPKGAYYSHRQPVLHTLAVLGSLASFGAHQRLHRGDVYMPLTPMFHAHAWGIPYMTTALGIKQVYPGRYLPDMLLALVVLKEESVSTVTEQQLQVHVKAWVDQGAISKWAVPDIRFVDKLEKTSVGKLDKKVLRQKHGLVDFPL